MEKIKTFHECSSNCRREGCPNCEHGYDEEHTCPDCDIKEPDTNDPSQFPAEGSDMDN